MEFATLDSGAGVVRLSILDRHAEYRGVGLKKGMYIRSMYMRCHEYGDSGESMLIDEYAKERVGESHRISTPLTRTQVP